MKFPDEFLPLPEGGMPLAGAKTAIDALRGTPFVNRATGIVARLSSSAKGKLVSNKATGKSTSNGFSREQHNAMAANVGRLFEMSAFALSRQGKEGDANVISIKRFVAKVSFGKRRAAAWITVKESKQFGHHIYSVEAIKLEALDRKVEVACASTPHASSAPTVKRIPFWQRAVKWARSCKQNIAEGSASSGTSKETEIKLTNVARATLDELLEDYLDYLKAHGAGEWAARDEKKKAAREYAKEHADWADWQKFFKTRDDVTCCNLMIVIIQQTKYLLDQMISELKSRLAEIIRRTRESAATIARRKGWSPLALSAHLSFSSLLSLLVVGGLALAGCASVPAWNALGDREETVAFFAEHEYGVRPVEKPPYLTFAAAEPDAVMMNGAAVRKRVRITYGGKYGTNSFVVTAFIPAKATKPAPSFLLICNRDPKENIDPTRTKKSGFWPAEEIVRRGYAAIAFWNGDIAPDWDTGNRAGVFACFDDVKEQYLPLNRWGTISAWAWGASRVMDWIETEPTLDAKHVAVIGHSRGGKTALWAAVTDTRFAMTCVNESGCSGAKLNHMELPKSEPVLAIYRRFPYWFCPRYAEAVNCETELPWDQHQLLATVAPRLLCVGDASEDHWAGQRGEFESCMLASAAWEAQGKKGLCADEFPPPESPIQIGSISYHLRTGKHNLTPYDWSVYMDFADKHGWRK